MWNGWKWIHYGNGSILWNLWNRNLLRPTMVISGSSPPSVTSMFLSLVHYNPPLLDAKATHPPTFLLLVMLDIRSRTDIPIDAPCRLSPSRSSFCRAERAVDCPLLFVLERMW